MEPVGAEDARRWYWVSLISAILAGVFVTYIVIFVWRRVDFPQAAQPNGATGDFPYFYTAAEAMAQKQDIYEAIPPGGDHPGYLYPPLVAFLYLPLTKLGVVWAARVSLLVNITALISAILIASREVLRRLGCIRWPIVISVAACAVLLSSDKIKSESQMLQTNCLVALAIVLGLRWLDRRPTWAGAALALAITIKYQAIALVLCLLIRRRWKAVVAGAGWTVVWAFLPALYLGFQQEAAYIVRALSGVLRMIGFHVGEDGAKVEPLSSTFSVSIPSAIARLVEHYGLGVNPFLIVAGIATLWMLLGAYIYHKHGFSLLTAPPEGRQHIASWRVVVGVEWMGVVAMVLAFSPQTNMRHLVLTVLLNILGVALALVTRGRGRVMAVTALVILWMGLNLPPGNQVPHQISSTTFWRGIGGPSWSILAATVLLVWAGLAVARSKAPSAKLGESTAS